MSRVGVKPIAVPSNVKVTIADSTVTVEGPKGTLKLDFHQAVKVGWSEDEKSIVVQTVREKGDLEKFEKALWGTTRALLANMIKGVTEGYNETMEIVGVGWGSEVQGNKLKLNVGFANPIFMDIPQGLEVKVDKMLVRIAGCDKQMVGQFAARMKSYRKPEPYNGKGIKYQSETIRRKQGKQFGS